MNIPGAVGQLFAGVHASSRKVARRVLVYGLQGSGNVISQEILRGVAGLRETFDQARQEAAEDHLERVQAFEDLAARISDAAASGIGHARPWSLNGFVMAGDDSVIFPDIPSRVVEVETIYGTHSLPDPRDVRAYQRSGGRAAVVLRHPLDVMASFATKSVPHDSPNRRERRNELLRDPAFVGMFAWQIETFWRHFRAIEEKVKVLHYEDLLSAPEAFIRDVETFLQKQAAPDVIADLLAKVGSAELSVPGHLFEARAGGWQGSLPDDMLGLFEKTRVMAQPYGYEWPSATYRPPEPTTSFHVVAYSYGERRLMRYLTARGLRHRCGKLPFICQAESALGARVRQVLDDRDLLARLTARAGTVGRWRRGLIRSRG